ncbi:hypothetical protein B0H66DRAFT_627231 [Apodospora peruviana]|uniref:Rhodopsin domain-containing protein n=1 Tax=Apodospora peruviana TaxID=516989 RepID=A0AAE0HXU7_9PEZI|nr:hypothetical protein B0H66DRAFT_627231 [Apodospora peruviana]
MGTSVALVSWTLWSLGLVAIGCRFLSQRLLHGPSSSFIQFFAKFQVDDYLMLLTAVTFTGVVVSSNQVAINGSNYVPDDGRLDRYSPEELARAEWGSKMLVSLEEFMLATLWLVKACLLILYGRMTSGLRQAMAVKAVAVYCAIGFVVIQVLYLCVWCWPIYNYWAVPVPDDHPQCKTYHHHMITVTIFNVSSDLAMLCIPLPMIARARLPLRRKLVLCGVFSLGVLVVLVAVLNRYFNFTMPNDHVFLGWYNGEASTAVLIANIPFCWSLLRRVFALDSWAAGSSSSRAAAAAAAAANMSSVVTSNLKQRQNAGGPQVPAGTDSRKSYPYGHHGRKNKNSVYSTVSSFDGVGESESMERITGMEIELESACGRKRKEESLDGLSLASDLEAGTGNTAAGSRHRGIGITKTVVIEQRSSQHG